MYSKLSLNENKEQLHSTKLSIKCAFSPFTIKVARFQMNPEGSVTHAINTLHDADC